MWHKTFTARLESWQELRKSCQAIDSIEVLRNVNSWWFCAPWQPYYLHWDDRPTWPDPWQLLDDNIYCSLARGLGIMYTIALLDRPDMQDSVLIETENDNLVLIDSGKYILNWDPTDIVNTSLDTALSSRHRITQQEIKAQIK